MAVEFVVLMLVIILCVSYIAIALYVYTDRSLDAAFKLRDSNDYEVHINGQKAIFIVKADNSSDAIRKVKLFLATKRVDNG